MSPWCSRSPASTRRCSSRCWIACAAVMPISWRRRATAPRAAGCARWCGRRCPAITRRALSTGLSDPTSGVFMMRRDALEALTPSLSSLGYQVLLDLIATARGRLRIVELAGRSHAWRQRSELKLALELLALLVAKFSNDAVSIRFLLFCLVGLSGVGVHLALLEVALITLSFTVAQTVATILTTVWNYTPQQCGHLWRPAPHRLVLRHRAGALPDRLRHRPRLQCRGREPDLCERHDMVDRRPRRRRDGRGLELRSQLGVRLAAALARMLGDRRHRPDRR